MTQISFYEIIASPVERVLPKLLEKVKSSGKRAVILVESEEKVEALSHVLWTYAQQSFLAHGTKKEGRAENQPIWLTNVPENPNNASVLILVDGCEDRNVDSYERCLYLYDGSLKESVSLAKEKKAIYEQQGHRIVTWRQDPSGQWVNN